MCEFASQFDPSFTSNYDPGVYIIIASDSSNTRRVNIG